MARKTPPIGISGAFILRDPFELDVNSSHTVIALRTFAEMIARGQNPLSLVYATVGLTQTAYDQDKAAGALVVCLRDKNGNLVYVPDTYIESYPNMGSVPYSRLVVGVSMGMWPDSADLSHVLQAIGESVRAKTGVTPELHVTRAVATDTVSESRHAQLVSVRQNAITDTETDTAKIIRLSDQVLALQATIAEQDALIEALVANQQVDP